MTISRRQLMRLAALIPLAPVAGKAEIPPYISPLAVPVKSEPTYYTLEQYTESMRLLAQQKHYRIRVSDKRWRFPTEPSEP